MKKVKVVLVRPNYHSHLITPLLGLGYLSSYLESKGYDSKIIGGLNLSYPIAQIIKKCQGVDFIVR